MGSIAGRNAIVTGAGQGVGRAIALRLARAGAGGIVVNDYHLDRAQTVAAEVVALGGRASAIAADVSDESGVTAMLAMAKATFGEIGVLINNAGNAGPVARPEFSSCPFWETSPDEWAHWFAVNLYGVMHC